MIFSTDCVRRAEILRRAYIIAGVCAALAGIVGYFKGIDILTLYGRARGTFKDPNVYGPFMVLPMLFLLQSFLAPRSACPVARRVPDHGGRTVPELFACRLGPYGVLVGDDDGAFVHDHTEWLVPRPPRRVLSDGKSRGCGSAGRPARGRQCRHGLQGTRFAEPILRHRRKRTVWQPKKSVAELIERPNGYGPLQFRNHFTNDPHQVYLNAFASYGWLGGFSYLALVLITLAIGLRTVFVDTPWQPYFIPVMATYTGVALEGLIIDTDHWRHYYLLLGLVWGFSIATMNFKRRAVTQAAA